MNRPAGDGGSRGSAHRNRRRSKIIEMLGFEGGREPLASVGEFNRRVVRVSAAMFAVLAAWLAVGVWGYWTLGKLTLVDAIYNASMIMGGMGPVDPLPSDGAKLFASAYAIVSGVLLLAAVGVMLSPLLHRILHRFHVDDDA